MRTATQIGFIILQWLFSPQKTSAVMLSLVNGRLLIYTLFHHHQTVRSTVPCFPADADMQQKIDSKVLSAFLRCLLTEIAEVLPWFVVFGL